MRVHLIKLSRRASLALCASMLMMAMAAAPLHAATDLGITKITGNATPIAGGAAFSYTLTVTNYGPDAANGVVVLDPMPPGIIFHSVSVVNNPSVAGFGLTCSGPAVATNGLVSCKGNLPAPAAGPVNSVSTITIVAQVVPGVAAGARTNTATVASDTQEASPNLNPNTASVQQTIQTNGNLILSMAGMGQVLSGNEIIYQISVNNTGSSDALNPTITQILPAGTEFLALYGTGALHDTCAANGGGFQVQCSPDSIPSGIHYLVVLAQTYPGITPSGTATSTATMTTGTAGGSGSPDTVETEVLNPATIITVGKTFSDDNPAAVEIDLQCTSGTVTVDDADADITDDAEFTVTLYETGATCTATEADLPVGYTSDNSACVDLALAGEDVDCTIDNQQNPVTVTVNKSYTQPQAWDPEVQITLTCPTATVTTTNPVNTAIGTATFTIEDFPYNGENCSATEALPLGYVQNSTTCGTLTVAPGAAAPSCLITNRPTEATFTVDKNYSDTNPVLAAAVTPLCTDEAGGPAITYTPANGNALHGTNFVTTVKYFNGVTNCTASELDQAGYSFVPGSSTCDTSTTISDAADGSCVIFNQQDPITILASKVFTSGGGTATFAASCDAGTLTTIKAEASTGSPAEFEISNFPWDGAECDVTEPVPLSGYYQVSSTCDDLAIVPSDDDTLCAITNAPTRATFTVTKEFTDGDNPTEVEVTINCFTGLPITQSQEIDETQSVEFIVTDFDHEELDCEITEEDLFGYTATYTAGGPGTFNNDGGCNFENVAGGAENTCHIVNDADFVPVEIEKLWVIDGSGGHQVDIGYKLTLYCDAIIEGGENHCYGGGPEMSLGGKGGYQTCKKFYGDGSEVFIAEVQPEWPSSHCWVDELVYDDAVEIDNGCGDLVISAGTGDSCLITNTVFFEGIPTLSQYGMAIMALLMLSIGLAGFRRFA